jgi:hypothetical protein
MATLETVRELALALPEVEESTSWGTPSFKVRRKGFARMWEDGEVLVVRIDMADRDFLVRSQPDKYFITPHYDGFPAVLVRLSTMGRDELRELLTAAWRLRAPARLAATLDGQRPAPDRARKGGRRER